MKKYFYWPKEFLSLVHMCLSVRVWFSWLYGRAGERARAQLSKISVRCVLTARVPFASYMSVQSVLLCEWIRYMRRNALKVPIKFFFSYPQIVCVLFDERWTMGRRTTECRRTNVTLYGYYCLCCELCAATIESNVIMRRMQATERHRDAFLLQFICFVARVFLFSSRNDLMCRDSLH